MVTTLKEVFVRFKMPDHRWFAAEAGYDLESIETRKKYFEVNYNLDLSEKRDYWILQVLDKKRTELAFDQINFQLNDYDTFSFKGGSI